MGSDVGAVCDWRRLMVFQSTLPAWGATVTVTFLVRYPSISIHAPRMGSDGAFLRRLYKRQISIHAPRMGSDQQEAEKAAASQNFNPRSPHGERQAVPGASLEEKQFQSTLPAWGATKLHVLLHGAIQFQSTLPAWGATAESGNSITYKSYFNPRSPHGERRIGRRYRQAYRNFNPRSPHGERPNIFPTSIPSIIFQSTLPAWGATCISGGRHMINVISIHAPRMGSDPSCTAIALRILGFQSTLPAWGATQNVW